MNFYDAFADKKVPKGTNIKNSILETIGNTPVIRLNCIERLYGLKSAVLAKAEFFNPYSVKDRVAVNMLMQARRRGQLKDGGTVIEPTSGNTGIGLAMAAAALGYKAVLVMPESMSVERRSLLAALGAQIVLTPAAEGMKGAIRRAESLAKETGGFMPSQFDNPDNPAAHSETTAKEILRDTGGLIDYFVASVGTGGTLTGAGRVLKERISGLKIIAVEPSASPVISGGAAGPHKIQGIGAGFVPANLETSLIDSVIRVTDADAAEFARTLAKTEGILCGISSGAALCAAVKTAAENPGKTVLTIFPDGGERYMSTGLFG